MASSEGNREDEVKGRLGLAYDFAWQMASFGPVLATKMSIYSTLSLPWGLGAAGAETVKQGVDAGDAEGISRPVKRASLAMVSLNLRFFTY